MIQRTFRLRSKFSMAFNYRNKLDEPNNGIEWSLNTIVIASYWDLVIWAREQIYNNNRNNIWDAFGNWRAIEWALTEWNHDKKKSHQIVWWSGVEWREYGGKNVLEETNVCLCSHLEKVKKIETELRTIERQREGATDIGSENRIEWYTLIFSLSSFSLSHSMWYSTYIKTPAHICDDRHVPNHQKMLSR